MKKFKIKKPTIMRIERITENAHQELINGSRRQDWNDKVPRVEKIYRKVIVLLESEPH